MSEILIRDLNEEVVNDESYYVVLDSPDFVEAKKMTVANFNSIEATTRADNDDTIKDSCGLETDYTLQPNESSHYVKTQDFVDAALDVSLKNALTLLDAKIYALNNRIFLEQYVTLTVAQLEESFTTGGTIISAPSSGYFINIIDIIGKNNKITTAWSTVGADTMDFICDSIVLGYLSNNFLTFDTILREKGVVNRGSGINLNPAKPLTWKTSVGDMTGGTEGISIRILFELVSDSFSATDLITNCCNIPVVNTFTNAELNGSFQLVINHGLGSEIVMGVVVIDPDGVSAFQTFKLGDGDNLFINKADFVTIEFGGAIAAGEWRYYFIVTTIS